MLVLLSIQYERYTFWRKNFRAKIFWKGCVGLPDLCDFLLHSRDLQRNRLIFLTNQNLVEILNDQLVFLVKSVFGRNFVDPPLFCVQNFKYPFLPLIRELRNYITSAQTLEPTHIFFINGVKND